MHALMWLAAMLAGLGLGAAIVLVASAPSMWRGALIQGAAPFLFLVLAVVHATA